MSTAESSSPKDKAIEWNTTVTMPTCMIERFDGQDYAIWARLMKNILKERKLWKYIDEKANIENYKEEEDEQALAEIQFTLSKLQMRLMIHSKTAYDMWKQLKDQHQHTSESNQMYLRNQLFGLKIKPDERMQEFINRINEMSDQLSALSDEKVPDKDKVLVLTRGVPNTYRNLVTAMHEAGRLGDYKHVTNSLINEEASQNESNIDTNTIEEKAFYSNNRGRNNQGGNRARNNFRGRSYNHGGQNQGGSTYRFDGNCNFCGIYGHKEFEC